MKKFILLILVMIFTFCWAKAQSYRVEGNTFTQVKTNSRSKAEPEKTEFIWSDTKGNKYPIYITSSGSCFIIKTSKNTGKEYRNYLKPDVCKEINHKLNRTYKPKQNGK